MSLCVKTGYQCNCQPDEGVFCPDYKPDKYVQCLMNAITELLSSSESKESAPHTEMAIAYVFNGTLYWPERLTDEQKSIAIPLFT